MIHLLGPDRPAPDFDSMSKLVISGGRPSLRVGFLVVMAAFTSLTGCDRSAADRLLVATTWPAIDRRRLASEFESWVAASHGNLEHRRIQLEWLTLGPGDDLVRVVERRDPPDVLLGGIALSFARLACAGQLTPIDDEGSVIKSIDRGISHVPGSSKKWHPVGAGHTRSSLPPGMPDGETRRTLRSMIHAGIRSSWPRRSTSSYVASGERDTPAWFERPGRDSPLS